MLSNREHSELVALIERAQSCLANNSMTPAEAYCLQEHGENLVELERTRRSMRGRFVRGMEKLSN